MRKYLFRPFLYSCLIGVVVLSLFILSSCGQLTPGVPSKTKVTLTGVVKDVGDVGVPNITVELYSVEEPVGEWFKNRAFSVQTNEEGRYSIRNLQKGYYAVAIRQGQTLTMYDQLVEAEITKQGKIEVNFDLSSRDNLKSLGYLRLYLENYGKKNVLKMSLSDIEGVSVNYVVVFPREKKTVTLNAVSSTYEQSVKVGERDILGDYEVTALWENELYSYTQRLQSFPPRFDFSIVPDGGNAHIEWDFDGGSHLFYIITQEGSTIWSSQRLITGNMTIIPAETTTITIPYARLKEQGAHLVRGIRIDGDSIFSFTVKSITDKPF
ncbi:hypothetical protein ACFL56_03665 [Candidatus Margulisiibacteriota bacterium]